MGALDTYGTGQNKEGTSTLCCRNVSRIFLHFSADVAALYHYQDASSKAILAEFGQCYVSDCIEYDKISPFDCSPAKPLHQKDVLQATCHLWGNLNWLTVILF